MREAVLKEEIKKYFVNIRKDVLNKEVTNYFDKVYDYAVVAEQKIAKNNKK